MSYCRNCILLSETHSSTKYQRFKIFFSHQRSQLLKSVSKPNMRFKESASFAMNSTVATVMLNAWIVLWWCLPNQFFKTSNGGYYDSTKNSSSMYSYQQHFWCIVCVCLVVVVFVDCFGFGFVFFLSPNLQQFLAAIFFFSALLHTDIRIRLFPC